MKKLLLSSIIFASTLFGADGYEVFKKTVWHVMQR